VYKVILALGLQDVDSKNIYCCNPGLYIIGQSSDHTILGIKEDKFRKSRDDYLNLEAGGIISFNLDDFGLEKLDTISRLILLEILEDRHGIKSTIVTSQLPVSSWHDVIGDPTISDAICDRIIHNSHRIELKSPSAREIYRNI
jgi:hypothetical protein